MPFIANRGEAHIELNPADPSAVLVSIIDPARHDVARVPPGYIDVLRMRFTDHGDEHPKNARVFNRSDAAAIVRFCRKYRGKNIVVHCAAGISRSGAVVEALLQAFPEYEDRGWPRFPNPMILAMMKRALGIVPIGAEK